MFYTEDRIRKQSSIETFLLLVLVIILNSCSENFLNEKPLSSLTDDLVLVDQSGFENYVDGLYWASRQEYMGQDNLFFITNFPGTDVGEDAGDEYFTYNNWSSYLTPVTPEVKDNWEWAYTTLINQANIILKAAEQVDDDIWDSETDKKNIIAQARFFRGYAYNFLANLYGGVPIVEDPILSPRFDFSRSSVEDTYEFARDDIKYAADNLYDVTQVDSDGRVTKGAANHLLAELNISLGDYSAAIEAANAVIESGNYHLMTERFGVMVDRPGDVFSDLFITGNRNRSSGNMESLFVWQVEPYTDGGAGSTAGNTDVRNLGPFLTKISSPDGFPNIPTDDLGRGVGRVRGTIYSLYSIWKDDDMDIRNSEYNFRRTFYYNNPNSKYYGEPIDYTKFSANDTLRNVYPYPRKFEGTPWEDNNTGGRTANNRYVYRLAETYLLRAEAYYRDNKPDLAANDLNEVRRRAHAKPIDANDVDINFILDERARELLFEEPRRKTLIRMGKLVERVKKYGLVEEWRNTIQDRNSLWPIPQSVIDANIESEFLQNPGY